MLPLTSRIAVIGAGPAGLSAALTLRERGFRSVTVLERETHVGGKCRSFSHRGHVYDLGANLTTPRYRTIRALADRLGLTQRKVADRRIVNLSQERFESLADAGLLEKLVVRGGASVYVGMRHLTGIDRHGYARLREGVARPFGEWLDRHGLEPFRELFEVLFVAYGYGRMLDLPAAYALKFFDRVHLEASIDTVMGKVVPFTTDFAEGFQELWERVDRQYEIGTLRGAAVEAVRRSPRGVEIAWRQGGEARSERFDALVVATGLQDARGFLDTSEEEERLFSQIRTNDYYVTLARVEGVPDLSTYLYPAARRFTPGEPTVFYPPIPTVGGEDDDVFVFYAYGGPGVDESVVRQRIEAAIRAPAIGGRVVEFLHTQKWRYFPHVDCAAMQAGFYDDVEALQGRWSTWYVGEVLAFTLVELNAEYSRQLVDTRLLR